MTGPEIDGAHDRFLDELAATALGLPEAEGFALAGGGAMRAHGLIERPTQDIDLFAPPGSSVPDLLRALSVTLRGEGYEVTVNQESPTFARVTVGGPDGLAATLDLALDARLGPVVELSVGPVLGLDDIAADKLLALWGRAEARDLVDVDALRDHLSDSQLLALATAKDHGFDVALLPDALGVAAGRPDERFTAIGVTGDALNKLRERAATWARELRDTATSPLGEARQALRLAGGAFPAPAPKTAHTPTDHQPPLPQTMNRAR